MDKLSKDRKEEILKKKASFISEGVSHCIDKHDRCEENRRYERGEQWKKGDIARQAEREKPAVPWNSISKVVNALSNREIVDRFVAKVFGRSLDDNGVANVLDEMCRWQRDSAETEFFESSAVRSMMIGGWGVMHKYWDQSLAGGDGLIVDEDIPIWNMLWPIRARQQNISDRKWNLCGKWVPVDDLEERYGGSTKDTKNFFRKVKAGKTFADTTVPVDRTVGTNGALNWGAPAGGVWINTASEEAFLIEMEWQELKTTFRAAVPKRLYDVYDFLNGVVPTLTVPGPPSEDPSQPSQDQQIDMPTWEQMDPSQQQQLIQQLMSETELKKFDTMSDLNSEVGDIYESIVGIPYNDYNKVIKTVTYFALITDDTVWDYGERPQGFTYEFLTGFPFETRDGIDFLGLVDYAKGPQDYKNALLSNVLAVYMASPKEGLMIEEDALSDFETFANQYSRPTGIIKVPNGFIQSNRYMKLQASQFPEITRELLQIADAGVEGMFGLSSIDLGNQSDLRRVSGTTVQAAKTAGNTIVAWLFDSIRKMRKRYQLLNLKYIQIMYSPEEIIRIVGQEKAQDIVDPSMWPETDKFDIKLDEEPVSTTERMEVMDFLTRTGTLDNWINRGNITFEDALTYFMPQIPESDKRALIEKHNTIQDLQNQLNTSNQQLQLFQQFIQLIPNGKDIMNQWALEQQQVQMLQQQSQGGDQGQQDQSQDQSQEQQPQQ